VADYQYDVLSDSYDVFCEDGCNPDENGFLGSFDDERDAIKVADADEDWHSDHDY
jgi:hypothetical protein